MISDEFRDDIKLFFDGLRNVAICVALFTGVPIIESITPIISGSNFLKYFVSIFSIGIIAGLYALNLIWLHVRFQQEPTTRIIHFISFTTLMIIITLATGASVFIKICPQLFAYA
jgi:hypothetical protein